MDLELLSALNAERSSRRAAAIVTEIANGRQRLVREDEVAADPLADLLSSKIAEGRSGLVESAGEIFFLNVQVPAIRIVVIGAVHISQAFAPMARLAGFDVTLIDPRTAFATAERFPDVRLLAEWPADALPALGGLDRYTALVALTHDPKIDDPALEAALRAECFYIGALGSRRTHARRVERLEQAGFGPEAIGRVCAPIGLDIGSVSPPEIAVAILAQLIGALRKDRRRGA